ncbi:hypothetical protein [Brockia lithotrophica]|uniref:Uncharacterized protein n=1 Tax=Brockia lithotrophica TaxID=933949 RepID=A0A660L719_9BACL|nr:hypothetical protein [Brockia lithotrophica]RKQ89014.1 hypothetical protein C7438_0669 [Brockia lithotrophica]
MDGKIERARRFGIDTAGEHGDLVVRDGRAYDLGGCGGSRTARWRIDAQGGILRPAVGALVVLGSMRAHLEEHPARGRAFWRRLFYAGVGTAVELFPYDGRLPFSLVWARAHRAYTDSPLTYAFVPVLPLAKFTPALVGELRRAGIALVWTYGERWPYPYGRRGTAEFVSRSGISVLHTLWSPVCGGELPSSRRGPVPHGELEAGAGFSAEGGGSEEEGPPFALLPDEPVRVVEEGLVVAGFCPAEFLLRVFCALGEFLARGGEGDAGPPWNCRAAVSARGGRSVSLELPEETALLGRPTLQGRLYRLLGLYPERGRLTPGATADFVLFPPRMGTRPPRFLFLDGVPYLLVRPSEEPLDSSLPSGDAGDGRAEPFRPRLPLAVWGPPWGRGYYLRATRRWSHGRLVSL